MKPIKRYIATLDEAIKAAKSRAATNYRTQYIYETQQGGQTVFYIRGLLEKERKPIMKVLYGGTVEQIEHEAGDVVGPPERTPIHGRSIC